MSLPRSFTHSIDNDTRTIHHSKVLFLLAIYIYKHCLLWCICFTLDRSVRWVRFVCVCCVGCVWCCTLWYAFFLMK
uniref:Uncharacterized protein n=1 Tax=Arundo donax TaxID=35708 RepID=A0A0A8ZR38_ARUDO